MDKLEITDKEVEMLLVAYVRGMYSALDSLDYRSLPEINKCATRVQELCDRLQRVRNRELDAIVEHNLRSREKG